MKVIVIATRKQDINQEELVKHLGPEADHVLGQIKEDVVREVYSRSDGQGAIVVLECEGVEHTRKIVGEFPLAKAGLLTAEFYGANPYRGIVQHVK